MHISLFVCAQKTVIPENMCDKCQNTCDINGNQQQDAFLDMDPNNKWKPSTVSMSADLSPSEPFGNNNNNDDDFNNYNNDDDDDFEPERPYTILKSVLPKLCHQHNQQQHCQPEFPSTSSLEKTGLNLDHSSDSLDKVEFCSTTDYR